SRRFAQTAKLFGGAHCFERARHDLRGACAVGVIADLRFEELGVSEDDPQLVIQAVEEETQFGCVGHGLRPQEHQAWLRPSVCHSVWPASRSVSFGWRHSVSTKILTDPPAVRTYSILPLESQL